jgi:hypothetical protein
MKSTKIHRRALLQGAGATIALPIFECMLNSHGTALAQGQPIPKRFVTWFFGNGVIRSKWTPATTGSNFALTEQLAPLVNAATNIDVKSYVSVLSGFDVKTPNLRGHHNGACAILSGAPFIPLPPNGAGYSSKFSIRSIDQIAADTLAQNTRFKSLQLAVSKRFTQGEGPTLAYMSHRSADEPMPQQSNPAALFNTLFANFTPSDPTDPRDRLRVSVLDAVKNDANRLKTKLGSADKIRLDAHLTGIAEARSRILSLPPVLTSSCIKPGTPSQTNTDVGGVEPIEDVSKIMSELLTVALVCDLSRVASFQFSGSVGGHVFKWLSPNEARLNEHAITHEIDQQNKVNDSVVFTMKCFAYLLDRMKKSIEGAGNLLDNTCILMSSDVAEGYDHSINDYPVLIAGKAQGKLRSGIHVRKPGNNTSDILFTCMKALGVPVTSVGAQQGQSSTAITELLVP